MNSTRTPARTRPQPSDEEMDRIFEAKAQWHRDQTNLPLKEKVRILLELQKQDYPLLKKLGKLEWWEKPWDIEP